MSTIIPGQTHKPSCTLADGACDCGNTAHWHQRLVRWLCQIFCRHNFRYEDLELTGIKPAEKPAENAPYKEQEAWFINRSTEDAYTKRVSWRCFKCGKVFYAHCGLDIFKHGKVLPPNESSSPTAADGRGRAERNNGKI